MLILFYLIAVFLLIWAKVKTDIKIHRVILLSFLPLVTVAIFFYILAVVDSRDIFGSLEVIYLVVVFGYMLLCPVLTISALFVKITQAKGVNVFNSAVFGSLFALVLFILLFAPYSRINSLLSPVIVLVSGFISVLIESRLFKGKQ